MELYIGGCAQGKLDYVKTLYPASLVFENTDDLKNNRKDGVKILNHLHLIIKQKLISGMENEAIELEIMQLAEKIPDLVIICNEIGNGIVPMDESERFYREFTGRLLIKIAAKADRVVRILCGLPQIIK